MDLDKIAKGCALLNGPLRSVKMKFRKIMQRRLGDLKKVSGVKKKSLKSKNFRDHLCIEVVLQLPVVDPCEDLHGTCGHISKLLNILKFHVFGIFWVISATPSDFMGHEISQNDHLIVGCG